MGLRQQTLSGALWSYIDTGFSTLVNFIFLIWLARLLDSSEFGLVAYAGVFIFVTTVLVEAGLAAAIVQRKDLGPRHVDTAYWANIGLGVLFAILLIASGPYIGAAVKEPGLAEIIPPLAAKLIFAGMSAVPIALLRRRMEFRRLAGINAIGVVISSISGVLIAYRGGGVWSLVYAQLILSATVAVGVTLTGRDPIGCKLRRDALYELVRFGGSILSMRLLTVVSERGTIFLIGYLFGASILGFYSVGNRFRTDLNTLLNSVMAKVLLPALSRLQDDRKRLKTAIGEINALRAITSFPVFLGLSAIAPEVVSLTVGPGWALSGQILAVALWTGVAVTINGATVSALSAIGKPHVVLTMNLIGSFGRLLAVGALAHFGIVAAVLGGVVVVLSYVPVRTYVFGRVTGISMREYLRPFVWPLFAALVMYGVMLSARLWALQDQTALARLTLCVLAGSAVYIGLMWAIDRPALRTVSGVVQEFRRIKLSGHPD